MSETVNLFFVVVVEGRRQVEPFLHRLLGQTQATAYATTGNNPIPTPLFVLIFLTILTVKLEVS